MRWLSLDVSAGAISILLLLGRSLEVTISNATYMALFSAIWFVYLFDHWHDSRLYEAHAERRKFYAKRRGILVTLMIVAVILGVGSLFLVPVRLLTGGIFLAAICGVYLLFSRYLAQLRLKELVVACCFACGCTLPLVVYVGGRHDIVIMTAELALLALSNLLLFALLEAEEDRLEGLESIGTRVTSTYLQKAIAVLLVINTVLGFSMQHLPWRYQAFILIGSFLLGIILLFPGFFIQKDRYRILGDGIFLLAMPLALI